MLELDVAMRDTGVVRERQSAQAVDQPGGGLGRRPNRLHGDPFVQGHAEGALDGHERPLLVHSDLENRHEVRMLEACDPASPIEPLGEHH